MGQGGGRTAIGLFQGISDFVQGKSDAPASAQSGLGVGAARELITGEKKKKTKVNSDMATVKFQNPEQDFLGL